MKQIKKSTMLKLENHYGKTPKMANTLNNKPKIAKKPLFAISLVILIALTLVSATIMWTKPIPSTVTVNSSYNAVVCNDAGFTQETTTANFPTIDRLDTAYKSSQTIYVKFTGSESAGMYFTIMATLPSAKWSFYFRTTIPLDTNNNPSGTLVSWDVNTTPTFTVTLWIKQDGTATKGNYAFTFQFVIDD